MTKKLKDLFAGEQLREIEGLCRKAKKNGEALKASIDSKITIFMSDRLTERTVIMKTTGSVSFFLKSKPGQMTAMDFFSLSVGEGCLLIDGTDIDLHDISSFVVHLSDGAQAPKTAEEKSNLINDILIESSPDFLRARQDGIAGAMTRSITFKERA